MPNRTGDDVGFINIFNVHSVPQRFTLSYQCAPDYIWWLQWQHIVGYRQQQYRAVGTWGQGGMCPSSFLADQLALSELGGQIMPTTVLLAPLDFQTFDGYNDNTLSDTDSINSDVSSGISISDLNARIGRHSGKFWQFFFQRTDFFYVSFKFLCCSCCSKLHWSFQ